MEHNKEQHPPRIMSNILAQINSTTIKLKGKILLTIVSYVLVALIIIILFGYLKLRSSSIKSAYGMLSMVENIKKQQIENELNRLQNQLQLFTSDSRTLGAFNSLLQGFSSIESDNYFTSGVSSSEEVRKKLEDFYVTQVIPRMEEKTGQTVDLEALLADDPKQIILQFLYLASNSRPLGYKHIVTGAGDGSLYSGIHVQYQPWLLTYARQFRISDIYFADAKSGYVFYSLKKNPDFGTNLLNGPYKNSSLSIAYHRALAASGKGNVFFTDMDQPIPGISPPCFYLSAPVILGNQVIGSVIFSIGSSHLDALLASKSDAKVNPNAEIKSLLIGSDLIYRCNDPELFTNRTRFIGALKRHGVPVEKAERVEKSSNSALILNVTGDLFTDARIGIAGTGRYTTPTGNTALCSYTPISNPGLSWIICTQTNLQDVLRTTRSLVLLLIALSILALLLLTYFTFLLSRKIVRRINNIKEALSSLVQGKEYSGLNAVSDDEIDSTIGVTQELMHRMGEVAQFASNLSEGKLDSEFEVKNTGDIMGISLNKLKDSMIQARMEDEKRKEEDETRNWTNHGIAMFNDILRQDNNDIRKLSYNITKNLIQYLSANQGGFFLLEDKQSGDQYLDMIAAYAFDRQKFLQKRIKVGEGLVGNCAQEKMTIHLKDIPKDYIEITSGLGSATPRSLLIVALKKEEEITGVIELASFNEFKKYEIEFVEKIAESIAATMVTVKLHEQTGILLEDSRKRSEEISQQEEELRQNLEELKSTQEEMARIRADEDEKEKKRRDSEQKILEQLKEQQQLLSKEKSLLDALLNNVPESIYFKDLQSRFLRFSSSMLKLFKLNKPEELIGKSDFDMFDEEHSRPAYEDEQKIIRTGEAMVDKVEKEVLPDGRVNYVNTTKMPLRDESNAIIGTFGISKDVTNYVTMQQDIEKKELIIKQKEEEIKRLQSELDKLKKRSKNS
jgi:PAS domain S-box-containing protein